MRVLMVSSSFPPTGWGGAEVAAEGISRWLVAHGHAVAVYTDSMAPAANRTSGEMFVPAKRPWNHRTQDHAGQSAPKKALWHLADHLPAHGGGEFAKVVVLFRPDVVMVHLAAGLGLGVFETCARHDLPVVFVLHDFWLTCLRSSMFSKGGQLCQTREMICRVSSALRWGVVSRVRRLGFWAPSKRIVEIIQQEKGDIFENLLLERYVVDLRDFTAGPAYIPQERPRLLYVGKVIAEKGVGFLLDCLRALPREAEFEIDILGNGDLLPELKARFAADERFRFRGVRTRAEVAAFYRTATLLLVPSLWFENSPLVIYQAQAAGVPVLGSDSGGIPDLLSGMPSSLVLPAGDRTAWTAKLGTLLGDRPFLAQWKERAIAQARIADETMDARGQRVVDFCRSL